MLMTSIAALLVVLLMVVYCAGLISRQMHIWLPAYLRQWMKQRRSKPAAEGPTHVIFCFADHYEPFCGKVDVDVAMERVQRWRRDYPTLARRYTDADGFHPVHTFFYPQEEYHADVVDEIAAICGAGFGEIEVHLHHDHDTSGGLKAKLVAFSSTLHERHGALAVRDGRPVFAFIHGNWALDNSRADGRWCGVNDELVALREVGCYADFTLPSAPSDTQTRCINSIYYATDDPERPKSHDKGVPAAVGAGATGDLLIVQGPLALHWRHRRFGLWPRIENGDIAPCSIPIEERVDLWVQQNVHVLGCPQWKFVKVHCHGATDENAEWLLGGELDRMFTHLRDRYNDGRDYVLHFVTARECYNIIKAAEAGQTGNPGSFRNYILARPGGLASGQGGLSA